MMQQRSSEDPCDPRETTTNEQQEVSTDAATIDALSDELLLEVLARAGVPSASAESSGSSAMLVTRAALEIRRSHLTCRREHACFKLPKDVEKAAELWRSGLAFTGLPEDLLANPLWSGSREAEGIYEHAAAQRAYGAVCKRWRALLGVERVKTAVCGVWDRPAQSVEALILAWDWRASETSDDNLLDFLADLPKLRVLVLWDSYQEPHQDDKWKTTPRAPPPLPWYMRSLQHLLILSASPRSTLGTAAAGIMASIAEQINLRTLVHPHVTAVPHDVFLDTVHKFPRLVNLDADGECLGLTHVVHLTDLRRLRIYASRGDTPRRRDHRDEPPHLARNPLATLRALESLELFGSGGGWGRGAVSCRYLSSVLADLSSLARLTHLCFQNVALAEIPLAHVAAAPALRSLRFVSCGLGTLAPLTALSGLSSLHVLNKKWVGDLHEPANIGAVSGITALADLRLEDCAHAFDGAPIRLSDAHTRLTRLDLTRCRLATADGVAVAGMSTLRRLRWIDVEGVSAVDEVVAALRPHSALESLVSRSEDIATRDTVAQLPISTMFPHLRELELCCSELLSLTDTLLPEVAQLTQLELLRLTNGVLADLTVPCLGQLKELRTVELAGVKGNLRWCLESLCSCPKLRVVSISSKTAIIRPAAALPELPFTLLWR